MIDFVQGDVLDWAAHYDGPKMHALLCDPPYELSFMGKAWDGTGIAFQAETWAALGEHLLPGAFGMAFASSRGYHRMAVAIEDAGFVLHSMIGWVYGSGFPKATRIDTQVDRAAGAEQETVLRRNFDGRLATNKNSNGSDGWKNSSDVRFTTIPATPLAATWAGHRYGLQALKPALEPICVFQKPYSGRPVDSITRTGAGALNIEAGRVGWDAAGLAGDQARRKVPRTDITGQGYAAGEGRPREYIGDPASPAGRWPSNLILDPCAAAALGRMSGKTNLHSHYSGRCVGFGAGREAGKETRKQYVTGVGTAARFFQQCDWVLEEAEPMFYAAKASRRERDSGLPNGQRCTHPTVKALSLTRYLATLLLPPAEYAPRRILVPFAGVGSECLGAALAGWDEVTGIEAEAEYVEMARARAGYWLMQPSMTLEAAE